MDDGFQLNSLTTNDGKPKITATTLAFGRFSESAISMLSEESDWYKIVTWCLSTLLWVFPVFMWLAVSGIRFRIESKGPCNVVCIHSDIILWLPCSRTTMPRLAFTQLLCLIWSVLCTGLVYECNFDGLKLKGVEQNLSSSIVPLTFTRQLPLSRVLSHSCIIRTDRKESFLHVKAKTYGETRGKYV